MVRMAVLQCTTVEPQASCCPHARHTSFHTPPSPLASLLYRLLLLAQLCAINFELHGSLRARAALPSTVSVVRFIPGGLVADCLP